MSDGEQRIEFILELQQHCPRWWKLQRNGFYTGGGLDGGWVDGWEEELLIDSATVVEVQVSTYYLFI